MLVGIRYAAQYAKLGPRATALDRDAIKRSLNLATGDAGTSAVWPAVKQRELSGALFEPDELWADVAARVRGKSNWRSQPARLSPATERARRAQTGSGRELCGRPMW